MKGCTHGILVAAILLAIVSAGTAPAQWSDDPYANLVLADLAGAKNMPKIAIAPGGDCYVSWLDDAGGGYDVCLQRLDRHGCEQWTHNGLVVADRSLSSTEDYGLDVDPVGNAILAFRDDRSGSLRVTAAKINPDGVPLWGPDGVQVSGPDEQIASPRVAATDDGGCVVAWTRISSRGETTTVRLQKLDDDGVPLWGDGVMLSDPDGGSFMLCDVQASGTDVIASWVRQGSNYWDPRHLWAQKFGPDGVPLWGDSPVIVFEGGTLQYGYFPRFVTDGSGGGVFSWYFIVGFDLDCAAQRILADGTEWLAHNGITASTAPRDRTYASATFHPASEAILLFWEEELSGSPDRYAVYGQKLTADRGRDWGDEGVAVCGFSPDRKGPVCSLPCADGAMVLFCGMLEGGSGLHAVRLDGDGDPVWSPAITLVSTTSVWRIDPTQNASEAALLAWTDGSQVYAQNVKPDGSLGVIPGDLDADGDVDLADLGDMLAAYGRCSGHPAFYPPADIDGDGCVALPDLAILLANFGP